MLLANGRVPKKNVFKKKKKTHNFVNKVCNEPNTVYSHFKSYKVRVCTLRERGHTLPTTLFKLVFKQIQKQIY